MAKKPPVIVRVLAWLFGDRSNGELITYLDQQRQAAERSAAAVHRRRAQHSLLGDALLGSPQRRGDDAP